MVSLCTADVFRVAKADKTSVSDFPMCQEFNLYNISTRSGGIFNNFGCGSITGTHSMEPSPISSRTYPASASGTFDFLPSAAATTTAATPSSPLSTSAIVSLLFGSVVLILVIAGLYYYRFKATKSRDPMRNFLHNLLSFVFNASCGVISSPWRLSGHRNSETVPQDQQEPRRDNTKKGRSEVKSAHSNRSVPKSGTFIDQLNSLSTSELTRWNGFLRIYGRRGILLRELIMLVSALYYPVAEICRYPHWSSNGQHDLTKPQKSEKNFLTLLKEASRPEYLQAMEEKLVVLDVMTVENVDPSKLGTGQDWVTDRRSWCARLRGRYSGFIDERLCLELLAVYSQIPDKDVHLMAERHRTLLYYHAHLALRYIFRELQQRRVRLNDMKTFYNMALQVLSHRSQPGDEDMIVFVHRGLFPDPPRLQGTPYTHDLSSQHIISQLLRVRADRRESILVETVEFFAQVVIQRDTIDRKAWGMAGYALSELMDIAERSDIYRKIVELARAWRDTALVSRTSLEMAALCCMLVRLREFATLDEMPQENHLSCGYYLGRAGFLQLAVYFITSGIHYCEKLIPESSIWRYHLELWTLKMRLGQWKEAEQWLSITWDRLSTRVDHLPAGEFDIWKQSGELGEFKMSIASFLSDCYTAQGNFMEARTMLLIALEDMVLMRDAVITDMRVALKSRLLSVQLQLQDFQSAAATAIDLGRELQLRENSPLEQQSICWTVQEILACIDELVKEGLHGDAYHVARGLRKLREKGCIVSSGNFPPSMEYLPDDLIVHIDRRWNVVKPLAELRDSVIQQELNSDLTLPFEIPIRPVRNGNQIQSPAVGSDPIIRKSRYDLKDYGYNFPAPASMTEATSVQKSTNVTGKQGLRTKFYTQTKRGNPRVGLFRKRQFPGWKTVRSPSRRDDTNQVLLELGELPKPPESDLPASVPREHPASMNISQRPIPETSWI